jgi:hypothetical protein
MVGGDVMFNIVVQRSAMASGARLYDAVWCQVML